MSRCIVVVGKAPRPGGTKTRLVPPLSFEEAAGLYRAFLGDTVALALALGWERALLVHPAGPSVARELRSFLPPGLRLEEQAGQGLEAALTGAFRTSFLAGFRRVVLIGSDSPTLPPALVEAAASGLEAHDLVIGPSLDGGYYLIGLRRPHLGVFERIAWSTSLVFEQTMARARELGLRTLVLPAWYDVDTAAELAHLRQHLSELPTSTAVRTRSALALMGDRLREPCDRLICRERIVPAQQQLNVAQATAPTDVRDHRCGAAPVRHRTGAGRTPTSTASP